MILDAQGIRSQHHSLPSLGNLHTELNMHFSLSIVTSLLVLSLAVNAAPAAGCTNSNGNVRQHNLYPRTPRPGNCLSEDCVDPSRPAFCSMSLYQNNFQSSQGRPIQESPQMKRLLKLCKNTCRCIPGGDGPTFELLCTGEAALPCRQACDCRKTYGDPGPGDRGDFAGTGSSGRQRYHGVNPGIIAGAAGVCSGASGGGG
jgi:hypothetical protein